MNYEKYYVKPPKVEIPMDQLIQLLRIVSDGDLISKDDRDQLVKIGFADRCEGYNFITSKGVYHLKYNDRLV